METDVEINYDAMSKAELISLYKQLKFRLECANKRIEELCSMCKTNAQYFDNVIDNAIKEDIKKGIYG